MVKLSQKHPVSVKLGVNCVSVDTCPINTGRLLRKALKIESKATLLS